MSNVQYGRKTYVSIIVGNTTPEVIAEYVYLEQVVKLGKSIFDEVNQQILLGWATFLSVRFL